MKTKCLIALLLLFTVISNAQTKKTKTQVTKSKKMTYEKHIALTKFELKSYKNYYSKLVDTTKKSKNSYVIYTKNEKLSNNFEVELVANFGECNSLHSYKGNLATYKKNPSSGIRRFSNEDTQSNSKDSVWVVTIQNDKIIMHYSYCFFTNSEGEIRAKSILLAYYDDGVNSLELYIRQKDGIAKESGLTKLKTEQEFKSKLPPAGELVKEVTEAMDAYLIALKE